MSKELVIVMHDSQPRFQMDTWSFTMQQWGIELLHKEKQTKKYIPWNSIKYAFTKESKE